MTKFPPSVLPPFSLRKRCNSSLMESKACATSCIFIAFEPLFTISPFLFFIVHKILPVPPLREQMEYHFSLLFLPCLPSILLFLPCLKHRCFIRLFKLSSSLGDCLVFLCASHPLLCLFNNFFFITLLKFLLLLC